MTNQTLPPRLVLPIGLRRAMTLFRGSAHALVAPQAVVLDDGVRARPLIRQGGHAAGSPEEQFVAAVHDLFGLIDGAGSHGRRLHAVVSEFWSRPLVLHFPGDAPSDEEVDAVLQSSYQRIYGDMTQGWSLSWSLKDAQLISVAWPAKGLAALREGLAQRAGILSSAKPLTLEVARAVLDPKESTWLAVIEPCSISIVRQQAGIWQDWCVIPGGADLAANLPMLLARAAARRNDDCKKLVVMDLADANNSDMLRKALMGEKWLPRFCLMNDLGKSDACRFYRAASDGASV